MGLVCRLAFRNRVLWQWLGLSATLVAVMAVVDLSGQAAREQVPAEAVLIPIAILAATLILVVRCRRAALAAAETTLRRALIDSSPAPMVLTDKSGRLIAANEAAHDLAWSDGAPQGKRFRDLWPEEARQLADDAFRRVIDEHSVCFEAPLRRSNDEPATWQVALKRVRITDGAGCVAVVLTDVTENVAAAESLKRKLDEETMLLDNVETQIWYLTDQQTYGAANRAHAEFVGHAKEELAGRNIYDIASRKTAAVCVDGNAEAFEQRKQIRAEVEIKDADGENRYLSIVKTPRLKTDGEVGYVVCTAQDVTESKRAEAGLRMQTSAINAASDQIIITDIAGRIEFANPAFEQETGYSFSEIAGQNPRFLRSGSQDVAFYALLWNTILNGRTWHGELTNRRKDGSHYVAQMTITPVKNESGAIERFVAITRNVTERKLFEQRMDYLAHHDPLTGLPNRLLVGHRLTHSIAEAAKNEWQVGVLFLDLDGFKFINDTMGHNVGDEVLKRAADRLRECCSDVDVLGRMGGDEFMIVLPQVPRAEEAAKMARRVLKAFSRVFVLNEDREVFISVTIGISLYPAHGTDVEALVKNADVAMYHAKELGRNNYHFYGEELNAAAVERMALENSLRRAVERREFEVHYQPRVDVASGKVLGAEALVRWRHPELGLVFPDQFIDVAEESGLIVPISEWVLRAACRQNRAWQDAGLPCVQIAVNMSARQFQRRNLLAIVRNALKESQLEPDYLEIELTESTLMQTPDHAADVLSKLKEMRVRISIDDFGIGYSSLNYLKRFPVDALKIDRSFIRDVTSDPDDAAITRAVVAMAHSLNLQVVAEGVETLEQLRYLFDLDCDEMQGYFVSAAVPPEEFELMLRRSQAEQTPLDLAA